LDFSFKKIDYRLKNLIENMLNFNKNKRIKTEEIFQCEWIKKYEFSLFGEPEDFSLKNIKNFDNIQNELILNNYNNNDKKIIQRTKTSFDVRENNNKQQFLDKVLNNIQNQPKKIKKKKRNISSLDYLKTEISNDIESIEQYHNKLKDYKNNNEFINDFNNKPRRTTKKNQNNNQKFVNKININFDNNNNNQPLLSENNKKFINGIVINDEDQKNKDAINMIENANKININIKDPNLNESKKKKVNLIQPSFWERFLSNFSCK